MSCCCSHIVTSWNPCCCQKPAVVTSSTTTTTTICVGGEVCEEALDPRCIIYNGPDINCYGIKTGDSAADILQIIINNINCFDATTTTTSTSTTTTSSTTTSTTSSTTTTTTAIPCNCISISNAENCVAEWVNCDGSPGFFDDWSTQPEIVICARENSVSITGLFPLCNPTVVVNGLCSTIDDCPLPSTTTTVAPVFRICLGYSPIFDSLAACEDANTCVNYVVQNAECQLNFTIGCLLFIDDLLTIPAPDGYYSDGTNLWTVETGVVTDQTICVPPVPTTTSTTSTTTSTTSTTSTTTSSTTTTTTEVPTTTTTTEFDFSKCLDCTPILDNVTDNGVGLLSVGNMTSTACTLGDYVIDWYLDSTSNPIEFTSGNIGNTDPAIQQFHPFTGSSARPSQGGSWIPVIRYAELDGIFYYSTSTPGGSLSTDLATCLTPITVLNLNCTNGDNSQAGFEQYSHKFQYVNGLQSPSDASKTLAFTLNSDGSTQYFAWYFEGVTVSDRLTFTYVSPLNATSTVLQDYAIGTDIPVTNFALTPKRLDSTFGKYVIDLTGIVYALGDYIQIDITAGFIDPLNTNTNWVLYMKCLDTFDTTWTRTVVDDCSPTMTFEPSLCRYRLDIGFSTFDDNKTTDTYKYLVTTDNEIANATKPSNAVPSTSIYFSAGLNSCNIQIAGAYNPSCTPAAGTISVVKTGPSYVWTFTSVTDFNKYQSEYNTAVSAVTPVGPTPPDTDINYYRFIRFHIQKYNNDSCGDTVITNTNTSIHYLTPVTFDAINLTMSFTVTSVNVANFYATLTSCAGTCASLSAANGVNAIAASVSNITYQTAATTMVTAVDNLFYVQTAPTTTFVEAYWIKRYTAFDYLIPSYPTPLANGWYNAATQNLYYDFRYQCTITDTLDPVNNFRIVSKIDPVTGAYSALNNFTVYEISAGVVTTPPGGCP